MFAGKNVINSFFQLPNVILSCFCSQNELLLLILFYQIMLTILLSNVFQRKYILALLKMCRLFYW
jgi:hypothetical protein